MPRLCQMLGVCDGTRDANMSTDIKPKIIQRNEMGEGQERYTFVDHLIFWKFSKCDLI